MRICTHSSRALFSMFIDTSENPLPASPALPALPLLDNAALDGGVVLGGALGDNAAASNARDDALPSPSAFGTETLRNEVLENGPNGHQPKLQIGNTKNTSVENVQVPVHTSSDNLYVTTFSSIDGSRNNSTEKDCTDNPTHIIVQDFSKFDDQGTTKNDSHNPVDDLNYADTIAFKDDNSDDFDNINNLDNDYKYE